jgi:hypothetical protein
MSLTAVTSKELEHDYPSTEIYPYVPVQGRNMAWLLGGVLLLDSFHFYIWGLDHVVDVMCHTTWIHCKHVAILGVTICINVYTGERL